MKKIIINTLLLIAMTNVYGQNVPINFNDCKYDTFFMVSEEPPQWIQKDTTIVDYFNQNCIKESIDFKSANGKILVGIIIFDDGKPCCHSFVNMTDTKIDPEWVKKLINEMPYWKPGRQAGKNVIVLKNLLVEIKNGKIVATK